MKVLRLSSAGKLLHALEDKKFEPIAFKCRFVRAGFIRYADNSPAPICIAAETLRLAVEEGAFNDKAVFIDHAEPCEPPSLRNLVGKTIHSTWDEQDQAVYGTIQLYDTEDGMAIADLLLQILADPKPPDIGLSLVFYPSLEVSSEATVITAIKHIESIDIVFQPAADGRFLQLLSSDRMIGNEKKKLPSNFQFATNDMENDMTIESSRDMVGEDEAKLGQDIEASLTASSAAEMEQRLAHMQQALRSYSFIANQSLILASDLPQVAKDKLLQQCQLYSSPAEVAQAIKAEKEYLASLVQEQVIHIGNVAPRSSQIQGGMTGFDQLTLAFEALLDGVRPPNGIKPLNGIREFYNLISGDYELSGVFHPERVMFANVNSSTMSSLVADALNKRVVNEFAKFPKWFEPIVREEDYQTLQDIKWITLAGIGALPTIDEGNAYPELAWDDKRETASFIKKGGYLGITIEAIDKDDTRKLRTAPAALAQGAYLTLSKAVAEIFTDATSGSAVGPILSDGYTLFDSVHHGNLGSSPLSSNAWAATRQAMRDQTEFAASGASAAALGMLTAPKYLLVPNELENTALQILGAAQSGSANYLDNVWAEGDTLTERMRSARSRVIVVDLWTNPKNWAAVADPLLYPTIGIGYRYGRAPEIFSVANPVSGLMFTNDTMPIKVRFFFAVGAMDYRGLYKHNVP